MIEREEVTAQSDQEVGAVPWAGGQRQAQLSAQVPVPCLPAQQEPASPASGSPVGEVTVTVPVGGSMLLLPAERREARTRC